MSSSIRDNVTKKWFEAMTVSIMNDETEVNKSKNRQRMREVRAKMAGFKMAGGTDCGSVGA
jgi:hypothetical protein